MLLHVQASMEETKKDLEAGMAKIDAELGRSALTLLTYMEWVGGGTYWRSLRGFVRAFIPEEQEVHG